MRARRLAASASIRSYAADLSRSAAAAAAAVAASRGGGAPDACSHCDQETIGGGGELLITSIPEEAYVSAFLTWPFFDAPFETSVASRGRTRADSTCATFPRSRGAKSRAAKTARAASCRRCQLLFFRATPSPRASKASSGTRAAAFPRIFASSLSPRAPRETLSCPASRNSADATTSAARAASSGEPATPASIQSGNASGAKKLADDHRRELAPFFKLASNSRNFRSRSVGASDRDVASSAHHALPPKNKDASTSGGLGFARSAS
mmetsp:Transcript_10673/g.45479  ORF Transcript_10673/g.45479 Transcript_10673/m.45479 type:complete len:266 (-) Transcript_10673:1853-2650(-)